MRNKDSASLHEKAKWTVGALAVVLLYFGAFGLLMYPVLDAAGRLA